MKCCRGFTLIEMIVSIVIVGVAVLGVISAFQTTVRHSADPVVMKQLMAAAESGMAETSLRTFTDFVDGTTTTTYSVVDGAVTVNYTVTTVIGTPGAAWNGVPAADTKTIKVTASKGTDTFELNGLRTKYAP